MHLTHLLRRNSLVIVGLNTGTSADGLDLAAVRIRRQGRAIEGAFIGGEEQAFSSELKNAILAVADAASVDLQSLLCLHNELGNVGGRMCRSFIRRLERRRVLVDCIAWHGQTVAHYPRLHRLGRSQFSASLQLGLPELVAGLTGRTVISDLRQADIALGGEGAPITVAAMERLFASRSEPRLIVNIGGMSNFFFFPARSSKQSSIRAADCGPGNVLIDMLTRQLFGEPMDRNGRFAAAGTVCDDLLESLLKNPFFSGRSGSTGREHFGPAVVQQVLDYSRRYELSTNDVLATVTELTAVAISRAVRRHISGPRPVKLYLTGGGRRNKLLVQRLQDRLPGCEIGRIDGLGIPGGLVEAAAFAVMGEAALRSDALPTLFTGRRARSVPVSGRIVQPPQQMPT